MSKLVDIRKYFLSDQVFPTFAGQEAAIRLFNMANPDDFSRLRATVQASGTQEFLEDVHSISDEEMIEWAKSDGRWHSQTGLLVAVVPSQQRLQRLRNEIGSDVDQLVDKPVGFVHIYTEFDLPPRIERMRELGYIPTQFTANSPVFEISAAVLPDSTGKQHSSGLMASAMRLAVCAAEKQKLEHMHAKSDDFWNSVHPESCITAFIESHNEPSRRAFEAAGFVYKGDLEYIVGTKEMCMAYVLDWNVLQTKLEERASRVNA